MSHYSPAYVVVDMSGSMSPYMPEILDALTEVHTPPPRPADLRIMPLVLELALQERDS